MPSPTSPASSSQTIVGAKYGQVDLVTDVTGSVFDLVRCKRCGMEGVFKLDEKGKAVSVFAFPAKLDSLNRTLLASVTSGKRAVCRISAKKFLTRDDKPERPVHA